MTGWTQGKRIVRWLTGAVGLSSLAATGVVSGALLGSTPASSATVPAPASTSTSVPSSGPSATPAPAPTAAQPSTTDPVAPAPAPPVQQSQGGQAHVQSSGS